MTDQAFQQYPSQHTTSLCHFTALPQLAGGSLTISLLQQFLQQHISSFFCIQFYPAIVLPLE